VSAQLALPVTPADCLDCGVDTHAAGDYYMVTDEVWHEANPGDTGMLLVACLEQRLGRTLTHRDFTLCSLNQGDHWAKSPLLHARLGASPCRRSPSR
jgi:hypothetical protein